MSLRVPFTALMLLAGGCATVDFDAPRQPSHAISPERESYLGTTYAAAQSAHAGQSGFHMINNGIEALSSRLLLIRQAQHTIDVQCYLIKQDTIGYAFTGALLDAAERGVRVRLLLDDIFTAGSDPGFLALNGHPNFEVLLFNPFPYRALRALNVLQLSRLNRRMHNKAFIVDNQIAIIGGRNIAAEYFAATGDINFGDMDALTVGPMVTDTSRMFDEYWNHRKSVPISVLVDSTGDADDARREFRRLQREAMRQLDNTAYALAIGESSDRTLADKGTTMTWASAELIYDSPDKAVRALKNGAPTMVPKLASTLLETKSELLVVTPYFIPGEYAINGLAELVSRGVTVRVVTNSLAANNHTIVHSGYGPKRKTLLQSGVQLYEVKSARVVPGSTRAGLGAARSTLHSKGFIIDGKILFIGSFNWDPRSVNINTEMGALIYSAELAQQLLDQVNASDDAGTYQVVLDDNDRLNWLEQQGDKTVVWTKEPETSWWKRFKVQLYRLLPVEAQL